MFFVFVLIINDVKSKKLQNNLKAQSTLSLYISATSSWQKSAQNELSFANFHFSINIIIYVPEI